MKPAAWRVALRIARRDALRAKGRSALVLAMIALPVLGVAGADIVYRSATLTPAEAATRTLGHADLLLTAVQPGMTVRQAPNPADGLTADGPKAGEQPTPEQGRSTGADPAALAKELLPAGSVLVPVTEGGDLLAATVDGQMRTGTQEADLGDPVWRGKINLVKGQPPAAAREIAVTQAFLDDSGLGLGGSTTLQGLGEQPFLITGVAEYPGSLRRSEVVARPGALSGRAGAQQSSGKGGRSGSSWLVRLPSGAKVDWAAVQDLGKYGFSATSRTVLLHPPARSAVPYYVEQDRHGGGGNRFNSTTVVILATVAGMALLEIVLLAGPAFAVGARRSRRQLGLLAAGGGDRAHIRAVVLGGGVVLGLAGAAVGAVLAAMAVAVARPWVERLGGARFGHLNLQPLDLLGVMGIGLVTGLLAAVVPAVQASRQDVVAALTGRGGVKPPSRKLTLLGLLMLAGGAALALFGATSGFGNRSTAVLGGSMIAELGMVACTPMVVGLFGRIGRWLPLGPRMALRDSVRHRGRTAPAVAAVMAAVAGSVAVGIYSASGDEQSRQAYVASAPRGAVTLLANGQPGTVAELAAQRTAVERTMPGIGPRADVRRVEYPADCDTGGKHCGYVSIDLPADRRCPSQDAVGRPSPADQARYAADPRCTHHGVSFGGNFGSVLTGDATVLHNLFGLHDSAAEQAVADGKVLVFDAALLENGKVAVKAFEPFTEEVSGQLPGPPASHELSADGIVVPLDHPAAQGFMSPQTAARLGLASSDAGSVWLPAAMPSSGAQQKATAAVGKVNGDSWALNVERGFQPQNSAISLGLTAFAALVALGAAGIATGLASADSQRDLTTLAAVGAAPRIRRTLSGFQCGVIAAMGAVLGTICGIVPAVALRKIEGTPTYVSPFEPPEPTHVVLAFPWLNIGITLVVLPLLAVLLATLLTRSKITLLRGTG